MTIQLEMLKEPKCWTAARDINRDWQYQGTLARTPWTSLSRARSRQTVKAD